MSSGRRGMGESGARRGSQRLGVRGTVIVERFECVRHRTDYFITTVPFSRAANLRRLRPAVWLRRLAASALSDNLIQRLNISSSALGASQKLVGRHKEMMLAALALKEKGRLVGSALPWSFGIHISGSSAPDNKRTPLNKAYAIGHAHLCTIGYIVYNCVTKGHGLVRIDTSFEPQMSVFM